MRVRKELFITYLITCETCGFDIEVDHFTKEYECGACHMRTDITNEETQYLEDEHNALQEKAP